MIDFFKKLLGLEGPSVTRIDALDAQARIKAGALLIDVRTPAERKSLKISDSKSMPLDQLSTQWQTLPTDRELILQCASGMRSAQAANFLAAKGLNVFNLKGGINAWQSAGLPIKR